MQVLARPGRAARHGGPELPEAPGAPLHPRWQRRHRHQHLVCPVGAEHAVRDAGGARPISQLPAPSI
eukprot:2854561-Pyramimonas_sp.AAC.1